MQEAAVFIQFCGKHKRPIHVDNSQGFGLPGDLAIWYFETSAVNYLCNHGELRDTGDSAIPIEEASRLAYLAGYVMGNIADQ